jgi:hypothetical protein
MRSLATLAIGAALVPAAAAAVDLRPELSAQGWFFSATGTADGTDLAAAGFDSSKGQPQLGVGVTIDDRHDIGVSYLRVRRHEQGTATGEVLGVLRVDDPVTSDLSVDYVRPHYGYRIVRDRWIDVEPFLELGVLRESTKIREGLFSQTSEQAETAVFPLPGVEVVLAAGFPARLRGRAEGIATGQGHLLDVQGGAEGAIGDVFGGFGYRVVDFAVEDHGDEVADVRLKGLYLEGGLRF